MKKLKLVIIESPYAGDVEKNMQYARACMRDSIKRGEAPYASHLLLTQVLDDTKEHEREKGIEIGLLWGARADVTAVYDDLGISPGMSKGIQRAIAERRPVQIRSIYKTKLESYGLE